MSDNLASLVEKIIKDQINNLNSLNKNDLGPNLKIWKANTNRLLQGKVINEELAAFNRINEDFYENDIKSYCKFFERLIIGIKEKPDMYLINSANPAVLQKSIEEPFFLKIKNTLLLKLKNKYLLTLIAALFLFFYFDIYQRVVYSPQEQYYLAKKYSKGCCGYPYDREKAEKWYLISANNGYSSAQATLGFNYGNGFWGDINEEKAIYWYKKAAEQGSKTAKLHLALYGVRQ